MAARYEVLEGEALTVLRGLAAGSANLVVTSPPYWGLRSYLGADDPLKALELGAERHPDEFVAHLVEVLGEAKRVLRDDGLAFVNIGDSHVNTRTHNGGGVPVNTVHRGSQREVLNVDGNHRANRSHRISDIPEKSLALIPERLALALQADGWVVRSRIVWAKGVSLCATYSGSVMPSSDPTKPTPAHEVVLMLAKGQRYWSDFEAVREPAAPASVKRIGQPGFAAQKGGVKDYGATGVNASQSARKALENYAASFDGSRNIRNVWVANEQVMRLREDVSDEQVALLEACFEAQGEGGWLRDVLAVSPKGSDEPHYAMYPPALITPLVRAGCPATTCCACGAPWRRVTEKTLGSDGRATLGARHGEGYAGARLDHRGKAPSGLQLNVGTLAFAPTCECAAGTQPGLVLDPFSGMATSGVCALQEGRRYLGIELNPKYAARSRERLANIPEPLFVVGRDDVSGSSDEVAAAQTSMFEDTD